MPKLSNRLPSYTLEDGTEIKSSAHSGCGWKGVALNPWDENRPFIATVGRGKIEEQNLEHLIVHESTFLIHFGWYADEREAAYVAALAQDPEWMEYMLSYHQSMMSVGSADGQELDTLGTMFIDFPSDLYEQSINLTAAEAYALTKKNTKKKSNKASKTLTKSEKSAHSANAKNKAVADARAKALAEMPAWLRALAPENS
tara:strand:- start:697 stop:1296 length:600 start_codon:yes stop_codon:yes gene_type:complete